jgi:hypothetical protein
MQNSAFSISSANYPKIPHKISSFKIFKNQNSPKFSNFPQNFHILHIPIKIFRKKPNSHHPKIPSQMNHLNIQHSGQKIRKSQDVNNTHNTLLCWWFISNQGKPYATKKATFRKLAFSPVPTIRNLDSAFFGNFTTLSQRSVYFGSFHSMNF